MVPKAKTPSATTPSPAVTTPKPTTKMLNNIQKITKKRQCVACGGDHFINRCEFLEQMGYKMTFINPNPRTTPALEVTNAARAAALCTTLQDQMDMPLQPSDTPPVSTNTPPEGKSHSTALPATMKQQRLVLATPTLTCTHIPASPLLLKSECSNTVEDKGPGNALDTKFVPLQVPASVSVVESRDCNTCNAKMTTSSILSSSENVTITPTKSDAHMTGDFPMQSTHDF
jgi:hypothetical protein